MTQLISREIRPVSRPEGLPVAPNFALVQAELKELQDRQVHARNFFMSVDPYMRGRMNEGASYVAPFKVGMSLDKCAVREVIESRANEFKQRDAVVSNADWREYFVASPQELHSVSREVQSLSIYLGALGMTAWAGLSLVEVKSGDVIYVSGTAGAVGNVVEQIAKLRGCKEIGSAGSTGKTSLLKDELGLDYAFNYEVGSILEHLGVAAPDGIDVYVR